MSQMTKRIIASAAVFLLAGAFPAAAGELNEKERLGLELARLTSSTGDEFEDLVREMLEQEHPEEPEELWDGLLEKVDFTEIDLGIARIYGRYMNESDMREVIRFHRSPAGQRWIAAQNSLRLETEAMTQEWLAPIVAQILEEAASMEYPDERIEDLAKLKATVHSFREIGTAMMSWLTDRVSDGQRTLAEDGSMSVERFFGVHREGQKKEPGEEGKLSYRVISHSQLESVLVPVYIEELPRTDAWGHALEFAMNEDLFSSFVLGLRSPGQDGVFETDDYTVGPFSQEERSQDLVWVDGYFARWPQD